MDEARALEALRGILARPEFTQARYVNAWEALWAALAALLIDFLNTLFLPAGEVIAGRGNWVQVAVVLVAAARLLGAGVFVARTVGLPMVRDASTGERAASERRTRSDRLWREAHELAAADRLVEARRALYLSALYGLEEHDVLRVEAALTNREHADRVARARPAASAAFAAVVQRYDRLRYGNVQ